MAGRFKERQQAWHKVPERLLRVTIEGREWWASWMWVRRGWECRATEAPLAPLRHMSPAQAKAWLDVRGLRSRWSSLDPFAADRWRDFPEWLEGVPVAGAELTMDLMAVPDVL